MSDTNAHFVFFTTIGAVLGIVAWIRTFFLQIKIAKLERRLEGK